MRGVRVYWEGERGVSSAAWRRRDFLRPRSAGFQSLEIRECDVCVCVRSALPQWQRAKKGSFARAKKVHSSWQREGKYPTSPHVLPVFNLWQLRVCVLWMEEKLQGGKKSLVCLIFGPSGTEGDHIRFAYQTTCTYSPSFPSPLFRFIFRLYDAAV